MKKVIFCAVLVLAAPALAQTPAADPIPIQLNAQERAALLAMCPAALWANRQAFDGMCDYFKTKFEAAEREAKAKAEKPATEKKE